MFIRWPFVSFAVAFLDLFHFHPFYFTFFGRRVRLPSLPCAVQPLFVLFAATNLFVPVADNRYCGRRLARVGANYEVRVVDRVG